MGAAHAILLPECYLKTAFEDLWEARLIHFELKKLELTRGEQGLSPDGNRTPTVQSSPRSTDTVISPANLLHGSPETHCTNDQGHNLNADGGSIKRPGCQFWRTICKPWHMLFPPGLERGFYIKMGGFELVSALGEGRDLPSDFKGGVTPRGAIELARRDLLPEVSLELINDLSKFDILAKLLVGIQASWMIIQCFARVAQSLPLTLLELHTVIQTMFAMLMYFLWLKKPHDINVSTKVQVDDEKLKILEGIVRDESPGFRLTEPVNALFGIVPQSSCGLFESKQSRVSKSVMAFFIGPIYGGLHLAAWKGHFPSNLERIMWIASALSIVGWTPFFVLSKFLSVFLLRWVTDHFAEERNKAWNPDVDLNDLRVHKSVLVYLGSRRKWGWFVVYLLLISLGIILFSCWAAARYYLVVESFASLRNLPIGIYDTVSWVTYIPHFE